MLREGELLRSARSPPVGIGTGGTVASAHTFKVEHFLHVLSAAVWRLDELLCIALLQSARAVRLMNLDLNWGCNEGQSGL